jgi:hypothetical protein
MTDAADLRARLDSVVEDVAELKRDRSSDRELLSAIRLEQVSQRVTIDQVGTMLAKHTDRAGDAFKTYLWPVLMIVVTALISKLLIWNSQ